MRESQLKNSMTQVEASNLDFLSARYTDVDARHCLCGGRYQSGGHERHVVWLAFTTNDSVTVWDDGCCMMRSASFVFNTNVGHCQFVFYDDNQQQFYTYSVDVKHGVSVSYTKQFTRDGWRFIQIDVTERQELAIRRMLIAQLTKDFDTAAVFWLKFWPRKTTGVRWFCSELMLTALKASGLASDGPEPYATPPHKLYQYMKTRNIGTYCEELTFVNSEGVRHFSNPVVATYGFKSGALTFQY